MRIPTRTLLWVYLVIPLGVLLMAIDLIYFDGYLRDHTPWIPESFFWYAVLFPFPHILISFVSFFDEEYAHYYRNKCLIGIPIILMISFFLPRYSITWTIITLALATIIHVALQQIGIALMLLRTGRTIIAGIWRWLNVIASILLYVLVFPISLPVFFTHELILQSSIILLGISSVLSIILLYNARRQGIYERWYFIGTALLPIVSLVAVTAQYTFMAIIISRLAHDITAFLFYYTHDYYRNQEHPQNFFAKLLAIPTPAYLISITIFAILISLTIRQEIWWGIASIYFISMLHYFIESFMWKAGTPHRQVIVAKNSFSRL
jgi:hypothetical protein